MSVSIDGACEVWREETRSARKAHECDACHETIRPGDKYVDHFDVYEGTTTHVKRCARCEKIWMHLFELCGDDECAPAQRLNCGHSYEDIHGEPPPPEIAALAFALPGEV